MPEAAKPVAKFKFDVSARLDFTFRYDVADSDGNTWLDPLESIVDDVDTKVEVFPATGVTVSRDVDPGGKFVVVWCEGDPATADVDYHVTLQIKTDSISSLSLTYDRIDQRTIVLQAQER